MVWLTVSSDKDMVYGRGKFIPLDAKKAINLAYIEVTVKRISASKSYL